MYKNKLVRKELFFLSTPQLYYQLAHAISQIDPYYEYLVDDIDAGEYSDLYSIETRTLYEIDDCPRYGFYFQDYPQHENGDYIINYKGQEVVIPALTMDRLYLQAIQYSGDIYCGNVLADEIYKYIRYHGFK